MKIQVQIQGYAESMTLQQLERFRALVTDEWAVSHWSPLRWAWIIRWLEGKKKTIARPFEAVEVPATPGNVLYFYETVLHEEKGRTGAA